MSSGQLPQQIQNIFGGLNPENQNALRDWLLNPTPQSSDVGTTGSGPIQLHSTASTSNGAPSGSSAAAPYLPSQSLAQQGGNTQRPVSPPVLAYHGLQGTSVCHFIMFITGGSLICSLRAPPPPVLPLPIHSISPILCSYLSAFRPSILPAAKGLHLPHNSLQSLLLPATLHHSFIRLTQPYHRLPLSGHPNHRHSLGFRHCSSNSQAQMLAGPPLQQRIGTLVGTLVGDKHVGPHTFNRDCQHNPPSPRPPHKSRPLLLLSTEQ